MKSDKPSQYQTHFSNSALQHNIEERRVLIVDDDIEILNLFSHTLKSEGLFPETAESISAMKDKLARAHFTAVLLDVYLGHESGIEALQFIMREYPNTKVIVITGSGSTDLAVEAMKLGASSYVTKNRPAKLVVEELKAVIFSQFVSTEKGVSQYQEGFSLIGKSVSMCRVRESIERMRNIESTILIGGESGTGKELVARALHQYSERGKEQFSAVNCGAIPENLLESELFGYKKGAFTDAKTDRKGIFEICSGGTLLLDEIGEMPLSLQVKLLRVLQEREIRPVGSTKTIKVDVHVIAATNLDLDEQMAKRKFREDLYYRLSVLRIDIPPLRERREDISHMVHHFIKRFNRRFGKTVEYPSHELMARLVAHPWKGNVRELQNVLERAVVLAPGRCLVLEDLFPRTVKEDSGPKGLYMPDQMGEYPMPFNELKKNLEKQYFTHLLKMTKGNVSEAARIAHEHRARIYRILKRYKINPESFKNA